MTAIEEVRQKLEDSGLGGRIEKTYHQLLTGYWWFPEPPGKSVYLGRSKEIALVAIDAERYSAKRDLPAEATWESLGRGFIEHEPDQTYGACD